MNLSVSRNTGTTHYTVNRHSPIFVFVLVEFDSLYCTEFNWFWIGESCTDALRHVTTDVRKLFSFSFNPLNAELNPIFHLLVLLWDLMFMGPCIISIFQYKSNKMQRYTIYLYLKTALHISGGTSTYHQERIQPYLQHLVFVTPLLLSAAIVEELEPVWVSCGWRTPPTAHSNRFQIFHDSGR
jgi:hypothetical protein